MGDRVWERMGDELEVEESRWEKKSDAHVTRFLFVVGGGWRDVVVWRR